MSWNNGQGNGNGQGYAQDDVYGRLNNTRDVGGARFPFIEDGTHRLALCTLEEFQHSSDGPSARALFAVLSSNKHAPESYVVKIWKLCKPPKFQGQASDADMFADFCRKLKGAPAGYPIGNDIRVLMKERPADQLARGTVIECVGVPNKKGTWTNIYWNAIQQSPQDIAAMRQRLEARGIPNTGAGPQGAPQQTPQNGYGAPPQLVPPSSPWGQPQGPVSAGLQQQQYGAPGVPPGGFLANVPPQGGQGGNGQGGQGGSGSW